MDLKKYNPDFVPYPVGFNNIGFTCYYNALLQSLLSCSSFVEEILETDSSSNLIKVLKGLINNSMKIDKVKNSDELKQEIAQLGPASWKFMIEDIAKKSISSAKFAIGQQCAAEGFSLFLDVLEKHTNIQTLFTYRRNIKIFCPNCGEEFSNTYELNNIFFVEANYTDHIISTGNLNDFLMNQKNDVDNNCVCTICNNRGNKPGTSSLTMVPEILFVMVKKYSHVRGHSRKLDNYINFPQKLEFEAKSGGKFMYSAVAQIDHVGGLNGGHYYAICFRRGKWVCMNDNSVYDADFNPNNNTYVVLYHFTNHEKKTSNTEGVSA